MVKKLAFVGAIALVGCCAYVHRNVIRAALNGEPMPKAPNWHVWVKEENRRG